MMKFLYLDDSGNSGLNLDDAEQPLFILGGVVIDTEEWQKINEEIQNIKAKYKIQDEIHAIEITNSKGIFKEWSLEKKNNLIKELLNIIVKYKLKIIFFKVIKKNYKAYFKTHFTQAQNKMLKIPPYILAYSYVLQIYEQSLNDDECNGIVISDEQDSDILADNTLKILRVIDEPDIKIKKIIEKNFFINSKESNLIQLADICVYHIKRYYEMEVKENISAKSKENREMFFKIIENNVYNLKLDPTQHKILGFLMNDF